MSFFTSMPSAAKASRNSLFCMLGAQAAMTSGRFACRKSARKRSPSSSQSCGMDHPELHRQLDAHPVDEVPDVHLLESRALAGADAHDQAGCAAVSAQFRSSLPLLCSSSAAQHVGERRRQTGGTTAHGGSLHVVRDSPDLHLHRRLGGRPQNHVGGARVAVLGSPDRAHVDEQRLSIPAEPGVVGVPEGEDVIRLGLRQSQVGPFVAVAEQVLVDAPRDCRAPSGPSCRRGPRAAPAAGCADRPSSRPSPRRP